VKEEEIHSDLLGLLDTLACLVLKEKKVNLETWVNRVFINAFITIVFSKSLKKILNKVIQTLFVQLMTVHVIFMDQKA
jgi:hypothetical protein